MIDDLDDLIQPCEAYCIHDVRCDQYGRLRRHLEHSGYDWRTGLVHDWLHSRPDLCATARPVLISRELARQLEYQEHQEHLRRPRIIDVELP